MYDPRKFGKSFPTRSHKEADLGHGTARISMSLPEELLIELDRVVARKGFPSRSHAIAVMLGDSLVRYRSEDETGVMVGTISVYYYHDAFDLPQQLAALQYSYIDEVISSLHVQLIRNQKMEIILVQGPATRLREIADSIRALRGVIYTKLELHGSAIPPLHPVDEAVSSS